MTVGIYGLFDTVTNECLYVGQSYNIEKRFQQHLRKLKNPNSLGSLRSFKNWYKDHNFQKDSLYMTILEETVDEDLIKNQREIYFFNFLKPKFYGKEPSVNDTWKHSDETKAKQRESVIRNLPVVSCEKCGKEFASTKNILCGICRKKSAKPPKPAKYKKCKNCEKSFLSKNDRRKYCSLFCSNECSRQSTMVNLDPEVLYNLYIVEEKSTTEIARIFSTTAPTVQKNLRKYNIPLRKRQDAARLFKQKEK